jgi:archaeal arginyl aminopeptidase
MKALVVSAQIFEDSELLVPYYRFLEAGIEVDISSFRLENIRGKHGYEVAVDKTFAQVESGDYDILLIPGGKAPAEVRRDPLALKIAKNFITKGKTVAAICHGPQILISAGIMSGRHATCYRTVAQEMIDAGALYEDREVVVDGNLVTSRRPADLPAFMRETMKLINRR